MDKIRGKLSLILITTISVISYFRVLARFRKKSICAEWELLHQEIDEIFREFHEFENFIHPF